MSGFLTTNNEHLIRSALWSTQLKEALEAELMGTKYVDWVTEFTDGDQINIPSIGTMEVLDYVEGQAIRYTAMDTGNYVFTIDKYVSSATYITDKMKQDSYLADRLISKFVPAEARAIAVNMEINMFEKFNAGQTASNANTINGAAHRWVATGTNETLSVNDFAKARFALQKANVPMTNLVAIVDPSFEYALNTMANITSLAYNPKWEGIINTGVSTTGMRFIVNIYGFDVYVSQYLPTANETINAGGGSRTTAAGVANFFFSASPDVVPMLGHIRQYPKVESERNKDMQRDEYVTTARWGFKNYRPENTVIVLSDTDQVTF